MPFDETPNISAKKPNKICQAFDFSLAHIKELHIHIYYNDALIYALPQRFFYATEAKTAY